MKKTLTILSLGVFLLPVLAGAQPVDPPTTITSMSGLVSMLNTITKWFFAIFMILAVFFLIYAAFIYLTSAGDEDKVKTAKKALIWAIVAIIVAVLARGIIALVENILTSGGGT